MKLSEKWLREWVDPPASTAELVAQLTAAGLEVDSVEPVAGAFSGVVVGEILEVFPHPDADKLRVCTVRAGEGPPLRVVCGAPNVRAGMRAPLATVGAELPGGMRVEHAKLRGVDSHGMLCSARELGLSDDAGGLLALPADAPAGADLREYLDLADVSIDVDLTPNRGDCLSVAGIAREVGVLYRMPVSGPAVEPVEAASDATFPVRLASAPDCPRYCGRVIRDIDPEAVTPLWMKERLRRSGLRSVSPVVDVTNYVLLELGQPMHAFDLETLQGAVVVRRARAGETLVLLDGQRIELDADTLVIADEKRPVALAGIMGGLDTAVTGRTRHIFLESAFFSPRTLSGEARRYALVTDSSHRFERGVDPTRQRRAVERATRLLLEIVGGEPGPLVEACVESELPSRVPVRLRPERIERVLGLQFPAGTVTEVLERLGMQVSMHGTDWHVVAPPFRFDVEIETDLIEEIARVVGYDQIPPTRPRAPLTINPSPEARVPLQRLRASLIERDYQEAITYSFVAPELQAALDPDRRVARLMNPISTDLSVMRTSLWPGLLQALLHNLNRQQERVRLFEAGLTFSYRGTTLLQERRLGGIATGPRVREQWADKTRNVDFFDVKSDVESLLAHCGASAHWEAAVHPALHPGQSAAISLEGDIVGWLGALHPRIARDFKLGAGVYLFEVALRALERGRLPAFRALSKFPAVRRDIAVVVDRSVTAAAVHDCVGQTAIDVLKNLELFDVYSGEGIDSGKKSLAIGLTFQAESRTLSDVEVESLVARVVDALGAELGGTLRG